MALMSKISRFMVRLMPVVRRRRSFIIMKTTIVRIMTLMSIEIEAVG